MYRMIKFLALLTMATCIHAAPQLAREMTTPAGQRVSTSALVDANKVIYPNDEVILILYHNLVRDGKLQPGKGLLSPNLNHEMLQEVYKFGLEIGYITEDTFFTPPSAPTLLFPKPNAKISSACIGYVGGCLLAVASFTGALLSCAAAAGEGGVNPGADAACKATLTGVGVGITVCAQMASCKLIEPPAGTTTLPLVGRRNGDVTEKYCAASYHGQSAFIFIRDGSVGRIVLRCSDGNDLTFGRNDFGTRITEICGGTRLVAGLETRSGERIDAVGMLCDEIRNTTEPDYPLGLEGGTGGNYLRVGCPQGKYVVGLKTWHDGDRIARRSAINGIEVKCQ